MQEDIVTVVRYHLVCAGGRRALQETRREVSIFGLRHNWQLAFLRNKQSCFLDHFSDFREKKRLSFFYDYSTDHKTHGGLVTYIGGG